ncbi:thioredoxin family protein [Streptosporangium lutulentum]
MDVEISQQIAQALRVQNVPALYAIFQGQPVAVVPGIATEQQLREWLTQLMEALAQYLPPAEENPADPEAEGEPQEPPSTRTCSPPSRPSTPVTSTAPWPPTSGCWPVRRTTRTRSWAWPDWG